MSKYNYGKVTLMKYENVTNGEVYFGYRVKDALIKEIDGIKYIEVVDTLTRPKQIWVKLDALKLIGDVMFDGKQ